MQTKMNHHQSLKNYKQTNLCRTKRNLTCKKSSAAFVPTQLPLTIAFKKRSLSARLISIFIAGGGFIMDKSKHLQLKYVVVIKNESIQNEFPILSNESRIRSTSKAVYQSFRYIIFRTNVRR